MTITRFLAAVLTTFTFAGQAVGAQWQTSWYAAPQPTWGADFALPTNVPAAVNGSTVREVVRLSTGGARVRVQLSNRYGTAPQTIGAVRIARTAADAGATSAIVPGDRVLAFAGRSSVTIPAGGTVTSDPADFPVAALARLTVSAWLPAAAPLTTFHWGAQQTGYIVAGDATAAPALPQAAELHGRAFLTAVQVESERAATVVALGDSITDGNGSTPDWHRRWPDQLADRLARDGIGVANAGISGARLLSARMGVKAEDRFAHDVLEQPGVRAVVVLLGTNDIGWPGTAFAPHEPPMTAQRLIAGYRALIARARARGVTIVGGTLPPFKGALPGTPFAGYWTPAKEAVRREVNGWIRDSGEFDAVADFDAALRDPSDPERIRPEYDCGDHLHPGDAGYAAMAAAVNKVLFF
ncbi:lysophospholipase L1-like esterase [Pseudoduganella flava]|uniref:Lysophospholipase L1-like esterase n=1 Tax=Pseudoduganella flava TaxID=871742 RepID=A0A562Q397_9BURK|nr:SGNH/GDSL hydrolase family protein [Pseudoduganella flava]QGZ41214.1 SGNH/GDSL hydrolase family protein [Pseudoduganella flava]TWI51148.1 lysophospholipase L1-like esterase [Pseudoduganella flava]